MISTLVRSTDWFHRRNKSHNIGIAYIVLNILFVAVVSRNTHVYKSQDCLLGNTVIAIFTTKTRGQCAFYCGGQNGAGFSYVPDSGKCTIFKQMFSDQSRCGISSNLYGSIDTCDSTVLLREEFRGNYTIHRPMSGDYSLARYRCMEYNDVRATEYCPISKCDQFWTPASLSCSEKDLFDINRRQWEGIVSCTIKGVTCQRWDSNWPHEHSLFNKRSDLHNWCQLNIDARPFCYTTDPDTRWDYCPVGEILGCDTSPPKTLPLKDVTLEIPYFDLMSVGRYKCTSLEQKNPEESCPVTKCLSDGSWSSANVSCSEKDCYDPINLTYDGRVTCTTTGISCQRWDSTYPHQEAYEYRNIGIANRCIMEDEKRPWCFTTNPDVWWDYCPVDICV